MRGDKLQAYNKSNVEKKELNFTDSKLMKSRNYLQVLKCLKNYPQEFNPNSFSLKESILLEDIVSVPNFWDHQEMHIPQGLFGLSMS